MEAAGGDARIAAELVELLAGEADRLGARIREGIAAGDRVAVVESAHALKGAAQVLGFGQLGAAAAAIEDAARAGVDLGPAMGALAARLSDPPQVRDLRDAPAAPPTG